MRKSILLLAVFALAILATNPSRAMTSISHEGPDGKVLTVSTAGEAGECSVHGGRLFCQDGPGFAVASLETGCVRTGGGGRCTIESDDPPFAVSALGSSIDVECETGSKKGYVFTIDDGDGGGGCGENRAVGGAVNGGTCTNGGSECTSMDCDHGCGSSTSGCQCHIKSRPKSPAE
jgi:hypothetical protein